MQNLYTSLYLISEEKYTYSLTSLLITSLAFIKPVRNMLVGWHGSPFYCTNTILLGDVWIWLRWWWCVCSDDYLCTAA